MNLTKYKEEFLLIKNTINQVKRKIKEWEGYLQCLKPTKY